MDSLFSDIRFGLRMMVKSPGFTLVAVLTLALGIGANSAMFTAVNAVMLKKLPIPAPDGLLVVGDPAMVHSFSVGTPRTDIFSYPLYRELVAHNGVFTSALASGRAGRVDLQIEGADKPEKPNVRMVSGNYFSVLGVEAQAGRLFGAEADAAVGATPAIVVSDRYWKSRFAGDPKVVGRVLRLNGFPFTVVGITREGFDGEIVGDRLDIFVPITMQLQLMPGRNYLDAPIYSWLQVMGRLKPGITEKQAESSLNTWIKATAPQLSAKLSTGDRDAFAKETIEVHDGSVGFSRVRSDFSKTLMVLLGIVGLVLLIACVNVANLLLARVTSRQKEIAIRLAMGARPRRLVQQLLTESVMLSLIGGACGLLLSRWIVTLLFRVTIQSAASALPVDVAMDWRILGFTAAVCIFSAILFGLAPASRAIHNELLPVLQEAGRGSSASRWSLGKVLVAGQVALSILVLFAAGLLLRTLQKMQSFDLGYDRVHLVDVRVDPLPAGYKEQRAAQLAATLAEQLRAGSGFEGVSFSENGVFAGTESADGVIVPGYTPPPGKNAVTWDDQVGPTYFYALGIRLVLGRDIGPQDTATSQKVAVVNQKFVKTFFHGENPIGRTFGIQDQPGAESIQIVGVAQDVHDHNVKGEVPPRAYFPYAQAFDKPEEFNLLVRATGDPRVAVETIRKVIAGVDPGLRVLDATPVSELVDKSLGQQQTLAQMSSYFAGLALLLASIGLYGIMSYSVAGRTRELGIRIALGAQRGRVLWMVLHETLWMVGFGVLVGIPAAIAGGRALNSMLFGLSAADPVSLVISVSILGGVAVLAGYVPAQRAARVDPMVALRYE